MAHVPLIDRALNAKYRFSDRRRLIVERLRSIFAQPHPAPILIFGNQKSGTSAIAGLLGAATGKRVQIDFRGAWEPFLSRLVNGETDVSRFISQNAFPFSADIVKEPALTFVAPMIMDACGVDRSLFIVRDPFQNIRSVLARLKIAGDLEEFTPSMRNLPNKTWVSIISGADLGNSGNYIEVQAKRWVRAAEIYLQEPSRYYLVRYEDFNREKKGTISAIARTFSLIPDHPIDRLLNHSFQQRGNYVADPHDFFGSRNYERIMSVCAAHLEVFGYHS